MEGTESNYQWYVGIDWGAERYEVCVLDRQAHVVARKSIEHSGTGIAEFVDWLVKWCAGKPERIAISIETPRGAMVESLVERTFAVFAINPKQLNRFRDRYTVAGAKDDSRDAFVLGDALRTDEHCFHRVGLEEAAILRMRELSRLEENLQEESNRLSNQLWEQLHRYYPQMLALSKAADEPWLWELIELAPRPAEARKLELARVQQLLGSHRIRRVGAEQVLEELKKEPLRLAPGAEEAACEHTLLLLPRLRLAHEQRTQVAKRIQRMLGEMSAAEPTEKADKREHSDVKILLSLPGVGRVVPATVLAEASGPLRERDYHSLRNYGGVAPVTRQSGKKKVVSMRYGCNMRLRNALYHWARTSTQKDAAAKKHYAALRQAGHSHGRATRGVADRWLAVLIAMLRAGTLYDPERREKGQARKGN